MRAIDLIRRALEFTERRTARIVADVRRAAGADLARGYRAWPTRRTWASGSWMRISPSGM